MTKPDFDKIFASGGTTLPLTDSQFLQGFEYLGENPPTKEEFNWLFQQLCLKMQWLNQNAGFGRWQADHTYAVGEICTPSAIGDYRQMECTVGGQSGTTEPTWGEVGSAVTDGGVTWIVRDMRQADSQFDKSGKIATTAFVQRALGNYQVQKPLSASTTLTVADLGKAIIAFGTAAMTITLPAASTCPSGTVLQFWSSNTNASGVTIAASGSDAIWVNETNVVSAKLYSGDSLTLVSDGSQWLAVGGTVQLKYSSKFAASLAASGYQKLPSGLIIQWGVATVPNDGNATVTFPIAFPSAAFGAQVTLVSANIGAAEGTESYNNLTKTQLTLQNGTNTTRDASYLVYGF